MKVYIKDRKTFQLKAILDAYSYKLVKSIYTDLSELTTEYNADITLNDVIYDNKGWIGLIEGLERDGDNLLNIKAGDISNLFSRKLIYISGDMKTTTEQTLRQAIVNYFVNESDEVYALPFVNATAGTQTQNTYPDLEEGLWSVRSYISKVRRLQSVYTEFSISGNALNVQILRKSLTPQKIFTTNRKLNITEESFSNISVAKITAYTLETDPPTSTDYYLLANGNITTTYQATGRASGDWECLKYEATDNVNDLVNSKFKENSYSHKITFVTNEEEAIWNFYDPVIVEIRKQTYTSYIAKKIINDDGTIEYQCGELKTTLSDKINKYL